MSYYRLKEGVFFVKGALRGALLDTNTENVYSINSAGVSVLTGKVESNSFWEKLVVMNLAERCDEPAALPDLPKLAEVNLNFIWFEIITSDCNESCIHCYADSMPPTHRRAKGLPAVQASDNKLAFEDWCTLIDEGYELGCRQCQFIGGEPFLYRDGDRTVLELAEHARAAGYEIIEIFTNATLLTKTKIQRIKELGINIAVSLYSHVPHVHDLITRTPGSHEKTMNSLQMLKEADVPTRIGLVAMRQNEHTLSETIQLVDNLGFRSSPPDPLRPKGRGDNVTLMPSPSTVVQYGVITAPHFRASRRVVEHYTVGHSCLAGKITITESGDVLPCIFSRTQILGNVKQMGGIRPVLLSSSLRKVWNTTKDNVLVCQDCEYRYVCFDCRPLSEAVAEGKAGYLHAPYPRCSYNPYTGEWARGLWRMSENGPVYDTAWANLLRKIADQTTASFVPTSH